MSQHEHDGGIGMCISVFCAPLESVPFSMRPYNGRVYPRSQVDRHAAPPHAATLSCRRIVVEASFDHGESGGIRHVGVIHDRARCCRSDRRTDCAFVTSVDVMPYW